jgi:hypothetical protein
MGKPNEPYYVLIVETFLKSGSGLHGDRHVRCIDGQFPPGLHVRFPRAVRYAYSVGTRFRIYAKLTDREGGKPFLHSNHAWDYEVLG